ncbi:hypothetical protein VT84_05570 [Gemmata sp. SH-PL17]|uniref:DUF4058 family protein n=1 Tax=Gemmata sp. SH-PL17 TaxID=1630693 RepID=UPI0004BB892D|nr:DUF4058 family protein [Gemmata sp. SH-PL17]AMV23861.1 hypothetical protein VT84_05570 [Gemmata sp. SH-PL17]
MPLYDHFHSPLSLRKSWESIHSAWAVMMVTRLNGALLSARFESEPKVHHGSQIEIDLAAYEEDRNLPMFGANGHNGGGVATHPQTYTPPVAALAGEVVMADADTFEINVYKQEGGWKLVAAVELVSPRNKDRSTARRAFATKMASYLQQGVSVVTIDVVTERNANLHEDVANALRLPDTFDWSSPTGLSAMCYRLLRVDGKERLEVWPHQLTIGASLPTVPLWLEPNLAVPLELELTYTSTCESLRIG